MQKKSPITVCAKKKLPLPFNETERNGSFHSRFIIFCYPFWIRSRSVRIFRPFWIRFNSFPCCAICFSAWQFMILIKERARMLLTGRMVFRDYTKKRILFYHAKGSHARSHHTHARSQRMHAHITCTLNHIRTAPSLSPPFIYFYFILFYFILIYF